MKHRKLVADPVQEGPVKAKSGPIEPPEETKDPIVRDPPAESQMLRDSEAPGNAKPCR